jgi:hypothetical protein
MRPLIVWRISDGRRGHDSQSLGLARALGRLTPCQTFDLPVLPWPQALAALLRRDFPGTGDLPDPHLIVGAGHGTHVSMLAARRARGGKSVVLMRPTLPASCFDFCIIPEHDPAPANDRILRSRGPLNAMSTASRQDPARGLILVGGPSGHFHWRFPELLPQIQALLAAGGMHWTVADSPRTPAADSERLAALASADFAHCSETGSDWLENQLRAAGTVWVTADSMSMIFEALTAGSAVGIFELRPRRADRVTGAVADLVTCGMVTPFQSWQPGQRLVAHQPALAEADRCASLLLQRLDAAGT